MNANVKVGNKRILTNKSTTDTKPLDQNSRPMEIKLANAGTNRKRRTAKNLDAFTRIPFR